MPYGMHIASSIRDMTTDQRFAVALSSYRVEVFYG